MLPEGISPGPSRQARETLETRRFAAYAKQDLSTYIRRINHVRIQIDAHVHTQMRVHVYIYIDTYAKVGTNSILYNHMYFKCAFVQTCLRQDDTRRVKIYIRRNT